MAHSTTSKAALTISQLLVFNSVKHVQTSGPSKSVRHNRSQETPLPIYVSMKIYAVTQSRGLVDTLFNLGLCVSYDRLLQLTSDLVNGICQCFRMEDVVCPPKLRQGLFTTAAVDNIGHNPCSATSKDSFHSTGISLVQHPMQTHRGTDRGVPVTGQGSSVKSVSSLPLSCTNVPPAVLKTKEFTAPVIQGPVRPPSVLEAKVAAVDKFKWITKVHKALKNSTVGSWISWSVYHADMQQNIIPPPAINPLLPLFLENAHSVAMIRHSMDIVKAVVHHLNPGQAPVLAADQPLFALAKEIQWTWPATYGEDNFIITFGGLHIEMAMLKLLGDWLENRGWTNALVQADIASSGVADSFINTSHVTKTRHVGRHQVTAASLFALQQAFNEDYVSYHLDLGQPRLTFDEWFIQRPNTSVHFNYWHKTLSLELLLLRFIRSLREGNFQLYVESLAQMMPWMFALDHMHYSRWLSIHIRAMTILAKKHPEVEAEFKSGNFVVYKTGNKFSAMALDQAHKQNNALVKGSGGAIGLTGPIPEHLNVGWYSKMLWTCYLTKYLQES